MPNPIDPENVLPREVRRPAPELEEKVLAPHPHPEPQLSKAQCDPNAEDRRARDQERLHDRRVGYPAGGVDARGEDQGRDDHRGGQGEGKPSRGP